MNAADIRKKEFGRKIQIKVENVKEIPIDKIDKGMIILIGENIRNRLNTRRDPPQTVIAKNNAKNSK